MSKEVVEKRIEEISTICEELSHLIPKEGWTDYAISLLVRLQKLAVILDDEDERADGMYEAFKNAWITTENNHKIHIGDDGNPDKGNPHVLAAIEGAIKSIEVKKRKRDMKCETPVTFENSGAVTTSKIGKKVCHFNHDENTMKVTRQVKVKDDNGRNFKICREDIEHLTVFAADDMKRKVDKAKYLAEQFGGDLKDWKHVKGIATIVDIEGNKSKADVHWFENPKVGQVLFKVKQFLEDMDESEIYWEE